MGLSHANISIENNGSTPAIGPAAILRRMLGSRLDPLVVRLFDDTVTVRERNSVAASSPATLLLRHGDRWVAFASRGGTGRCVVHLFKIVNISVKRISKVWSLCARADPAS